MADTLRLGAFLDNMIDAAGERVSEAETAYRRALRGSDWTHVTNARCALEQAMRERAALLESMSDAGRAWYDRIIRDELNAELDRALHNERATAQAQAEKE